jgi:hypothetical protein
MEGWSSEILEYWVLKAEKGLFYKNIESSFFDDTHRATIFYFCPTLHCILTRKSMQKYVLRIPFSLNPSFQNSNVPSFQLGRSP